MLPVHQRKEGILNKKSVTIVGIIVLVLAVIWLFYLKNTSYEKPEQAIRATEKNLTLIPAHQTDNQALYFFVKDDRNYGVTYAQRGMWGWKTRGIIWTKIHDDRNTSEKLTGYQEYEGQLMYGLLKNTKNRAIYFNKQQATFLNLDELPKEVVKKYRLQGMAIWYLEHDAVIEKGVLRLVDTKTNKTIHRIVIK